MALEVRYVGTRGVNQWSTLNYNERNIIENGFLDEFKLAMTNLRANNAAGGARSGSFAYFGPGSGTNPLPIYLAYLNGRTGCRQPGGVHRRHGDLDERDARRPAGAHQSESELRQQPDGDRRPTPTPTPPAISTTT